MPNFAVGGRVFVYKPSTKTGKAYKFAKPFHGPYRILTLHEGGADVVLIERPKEASIRVPFERLRVCPEEIPESSPPAQDVATECFTCPPPQLTLLLQLLPLAIQWGLDIYEREIKSNCSRMPRLRVRTCNGYYVMVLRISIY